MRLSICYFHIVACWSLFIDLGFGLLRSIVQNFEILPSPHPRDSRSANAIAANLEYDYSVGNSNSAQLVTGMYITRQLEEPTSHRIHTPSLNARSSGDCHLRMSNECNSGGLQEIRFREETHYSNSFLFPVLRRCVMLQPVIVNRFRVAGILAPVCTFHGGDM
ncbi:hypothetical protein F5I97DRAFT_308432 [Phlebopus sp. FC_14]|nr:hypothetical protein F5I97DRAFT_308432 [Phlebopus sp. FC_14]